MPQIRPRIWLDDAAPYPEMALPEVRARPSTGLCLSGGGSRATCAAVGYLRGLLELGLLDRLRYTSAVSGGSWASVPYTFWQTGAESDEALLGPIIAPEDLDRARLRREIAPSALLSAVTGSVRDTMIEMLPTLTPGQAWITAITRLFLAPWGLSRPEAPRSYTWSRATLAALLERQRPLPGTTLGADDFVVARPDRPFPIVNACLLGPSQDGNPGRLAELVPVGFQLTPLYAGYRPALDVRYRYKGDAPVQRRVGGGLVSTFALGSGGPGWLGEGAVQEATLERPVELSDLRFAIGTSSCAFASTLAELTGVPQRIPIARYWAPGRGDLPASETWEFGDGGIIENYGLLALLQREVSTAIVLVNTAQKLDLDWTPGDGSTYRSKIDPYLPPLFGVHEQVNAIATHRNQVFPTGDLAGVVADLQAAKRRGDPLIAVREHTVLDNPWWGIRGGRTVRVAWVYLDRAARFEARLPRSTAKLVELGNSRGGAGPFPKFPNYRTISANLFSITRLDAAQARLLANLCAWSVLDQRETFERLLR